MLVNLPDLTDAPDTRQVTLTLSAESVSILEAAISGLCSGNWEVLGGGHRLNHLMLDWHRAQGALDPSHAEIARHAESAYKIVRDQNVRDSIERITRDQAARGTDLRGL